MAGCPTLRAFVLGEGWAAPRHASCEPGKNPRILRHTALRASYTGERTSSGSQSSDSMSLPFANFAGPQTILLLLAACGLCGGIYIFVRGFQMLRTKRLIQDTPHSKIHSAAIGLVELNGTGVAPWKVISPVTQEPCLYYRVRAWQWVEEQDKHHWEQVLEESLAVPFLLEDSTGKILVVPDGAEFDAHPSFSDEIALTFFSTPGMLPPNVRNFLVSRALVPREKLRVKEEILPLGFPLFVFGKLGENPPAGSPISAPPSASPQPHAASDLENIVMHSPVAVAKGQQHEPFIISLQSPKEVTGKLSWQSATRIWGGPVLAIVSLYCLLVFLQWVP